MKALVGAFFVCGEGIFSVRKRWGFSGLASMGLGAKPLSLRPGGFAPSPPWAAPSDCDSLTTNVVTWWYPATTEVTALESTPDRLLIADAATAFGRSVSAVRRLLELGKLQNTIRDARGRVLLDRDELVAYYSALDGKDVVATRLAGANRRALGATAGTSQVPVSEVVEEELRRLRAELDEARAAYRAEKALRERDLEHHRAVEAELRQQLMPTLGALLKTIQTLALPPAQPERHDIVVEAEAVSSRRASRAKPVTTPKQASRRPSGAKEAAAGAKRKLSRATIAGAKARRKR